MTWKHLSLSATTTAETTHAAYIAVDYFESITRIFFLTIVFLIARVFLEVASVK